MQSETSDSEALERSVTRAGKRPAHAKIMLSPHKEDIDYWLFVEKLSVNDVWEKVRDELGVTDINYMALLRYKQDRVKTNVPRVILETSQAEAKKTWDTLSIIIQAALDVIHAGGKPTIQDALRAAKLQSDLIKQYGIDFQFQATDTAKRMLTHLLRDVIVPNITEEQRLVIAEAIASDPELQDWVMMEQG